MITVYTQPGCRPCERVKKKLADAKLPHRVVDVTKDEAGLAYLNSIGAKSVPVIDPGNGYEPIKGYEPTLLNYLIDTYPRLDIKPEGSHNGD